jgi:hypothetical protein
VGFFSRNRVLDIRADSFRDNPTAHRSGRLFGTCADRRQELAARVFDHIPSSGVALVGKVESLQKLSIK